jgi:hypothetical protein
VRGGLALVLLVAARVPQSGPQGTGAATQFGALQDTGIVRVISQALFERLNWRIAQAAGDTTSRSWSITLRTGGVPGEWDRLRTHLLTALRGRPHVEGEPDNSRLIVDSLRVLGDTLRAFLVINPTWRCRDGTWRETLYFFEIRAVRYGDRWGSPATKQTYDADALLCPSV